MLIPLDSMPDGARKLCEQADISAVAQRFADFDGTDIEQVALTVSSQLADLLPLYDRSRRSTLQSISIGRGGCAHRGTAVQAVFEQVPNVLSGLVVKPGHMFNVVASKITRQVVVVENDFHSEYKKGDNEDEVITTEYGDFYTFDVTETTDNELKLNGELLLDMLDTSDTTRAYGISSHEGMHVYQKLKRGEQPPCTKVVLFAGISALKFIDKNYS